MVKQSPAARVPPRPSEQAQHLTDLLSAAGHEARSTAAAAFAAAAQNAAAEQPAYEWGFSGFGNVVFSGPPRPREAFYTQSEQQVKAQRVDDGMEQSLVLYEATALPPAPMHLAAMQNFADFQQSSAATIGSTIVSAAAADEGVDQPSQQPLAIAAVAFSFEEGAAAAPDTQILKQALADILESRKQAALAHKQLMASSRAAERDIRALLSARAAPVPPMQPPPLAQPPKQKPSLQKKQPAQQSKQSQQQPAKQPTQQPRYADVVAATCGAMTSAAVKAILPAPTQPQPQWQQQPHQRKAQRPKQHQQQTQQQHQKQPKRQERAAVGVDRFSHRLHFSVSGESLDTLGSAAEVARRVVAQVEGGAGVTVVDAVRLGPAAAPRFQFKVATVEQADILIRGRGKAFSGSGIVLSEVLSPAESALHKQLWPVFISLQKAGRRVQFRRSRLFVDGQLWSNAMSPAAV